MTRGRSIELIRALPVERTDLRLPVAKAPADAQKRADLVAIADSYKRQFSQQSVLTKVGNVCVTF